MFTYLKASGTFEFFDSKDDGEWCRSVDYDQASSET